WGGGGAPGARGWGGGVLPVTHTLTRRRAARSATLSRGAGEGPSSHFRRKAGARLRPGLRANHIIRGAVRRANLASAARLAVRHHHGQYAQAVLANRDLADRRAEVGIDPF